MTIFDTCFDRLIGHEGTLSMDPRDPGNWTGGSVGVGQLKGTKFGISAASYPKLDIANLTRGQSWALYKQDFWDQINGDQFHLGIGFQVFDFAVNSGMPTAIRYLQRALGVADDGHWGPVTQAAAESQDQVHVIMLLLAERQEYMTKLNNWPDAGKGWARRIASCLRYGVSDT